MAGRTVRGATAMLGAALAAAAAGGAAAPEPVARLAVWPDQAGWFVCDAVAGPYAAFVSKPDATRTSQVTLLDRTTGRTTTTAYTVGDGDAGAGSLFWSLSRGGREAGAIRSVNPAMVDGGDRYLPPVRNLRIGEIALDCRWLAHMRYIGLDARRSVTVSEEPDGLVYRSYDVARRGGVLHPDDVQTTTAATATVGGGRDDGGAFRFEKGGYGYVLDHRGVGMLTVLRGGAIVQKEPLTMAAWQTAARPARGVVWSGTGLDACRAPDTHDIDRCLIDAMRTSGAAPAAIAFAERIAARGDTGYVSAWRQAGPIGVATVAYPFRANTNEGTVLVPAAGDPIFVDDYRLGVQAKARADYRALVARAGDVTPFAPATISGRRPLVGEPIVIRARTPMATCHACAPAGDLVVDYEFSPAGRLATTRLISIG